MTSSEDVRALSADKRALSADARALSADAKALSADIRALKVAANRYCDPVAWPTLVLAVFNAASFVAVPMFTAMGVLPLWLAVPLMAFVYYASYTPLHEAVHGAVCGGGRRFRWLNDAVGYLSGVLVGIPYTAHRHEHFLHHANTNHAENDPDMVCADMGQGPLVALLACDRLLRAQYAIFIRDRWTPEHGNLKRNFVLEILANLATRLGLLAMIAIIASGHGAGWVEILWMGIALLLIAYSLGTVLLVYLFAYIVHTPHRQQGKFVDTSVFLLPGWLRNLGTWLWGFQNYHGVHHAFPRVPWYRYRQLYEAQEPALRAQSLPVHSLQGFSWQRQPIHSGELST